MDRNGLGFCYYRNDIPDVALRKESVDRNFSDVSLNYKEVLSLSARRAWIEIRGGKRFRGCSLVALRKESVDRNILHMAHLTELLKSLSARRAWIEIRKRNTPSHNPKMSLSARRAWIEMPCMSMAALRQAVALRKESVDRNVLWR